RRRTCSTPKSRAWRSRAPSRSTRTTRSSFRTRASLRSPSGSGRRPCSSSTTRSCVWRVNFFRGARPDETRKRSLERCRRRARQLRSKLGARLSHHAREHPRIESVRHVQIVLRPRRDFAKVVLGERVAHTALENVRIAVEVLQVRPILLFFLGIAKGLAHSD